MLSYEIIAEDKLATFDPMELFDLVWASDPHVSPDGSAIVDVRRSNDIMTVR